MAMCCPNHLPKIETVNTIGQFHKVRAKPNVIVHTDALRSAARSQRHFTFFFLAVDDGTTHKTILRNHYTF